MRTETDTFATAITAAPAVTAWYDALGPSAQSAFHGAGEPPNVEPSRIIPGLAPGVLLAGRYRLEQALGAGAFAVVYAAWDLSLFRRVAVKVYSDAAAGPVSTDEARLQATCQHPNLMPLHDAGGDPQLGVSFLVMPLYPGADLGATLNRYGPLPFRSALLCADQVCSALEFLWQRRQTIHGDLKPSNIWLTHSGAALLMDFNLPGLLARGGSACAGTPGFTAPEVFQGRRDPRSDVFSLGCVLYQCLGGAAPFPDDVAARAGRFTPLRRLRPELKPELEAVIHTAMAADPDRRYQSAREFQSALRRPRRLGALSWRNALLWLGALWEGVLVCAGGLLRCLGWGYRTGWRLLTRFARHARRRPGQAALEALGLLIAGQGACQIARHWLARHQAQADAVLVAAPAAALLLATVAARFRRRTYRTGRRGR